MRYWIVQNKHTKDYLPQPQPGCGATRYKLEPTGRRRYAPRPFTNPGDASKAMTWWLSGPWFQGGGGDEGGYPDRTTSSLEHLERQLLVGQLEVKEIWLDMKARK